MRKVLEEFRLIAVIGLLLIPIVLLGWLFFIQMREQIAFAEKERAGLTYLRTIVPIYVETIVSVDGPTFEQKQSLESARKIHDEAMKSGPHSTQLASALAINAGRMETQLALRSLITRIGDQSNLILDPDLDSYYLMDVTLLRIPELLQFVAETKATLEAVRLYGQQSDQLMLLNGQLRGAILALDQSINSASESNADGSVRQGLWSKTAELNANAKLLSAGLQAFTSKKEFANTDFQTLLALSDKLTLNMRQFWSHNSDQLDRLLRLRTEKFKTWLNLAIGLSAVVTLLAMALAGTVLRKLLHRLDDKIIYLAHHDPMTQLKNRVTFTADMEALLKAADISGERLALHLIDLDQFKSINDTLGHQTGDAVLKDLAARLTKHCRKSDIVGRLGGDEFVVLQRDVSEKFSAETYVERLLQGMRAPLLVGEQVVSYSVSVGSALAPLHASTSDKLMACADLALYASKESGRNRATTFTRDLNTEVQKRRAIEQQVRRALAEDKFDLNFQPQFDASGTHLRGFEALLRLTSSTGENIPPNTFIPIAEQIGLINQIGAWVLRKACSVAATWPHDIKLAVNLSPLQFKTGNVCNDIAAALTQSGLSPSRLEVEITEGILMTNADIVLDELKAIRALGVSIAMDDFGTGFSSLSYLWKFPFNKIKIDRSFIMALDEDEKNAENILRTIVNLGHSLKMIVIAEGVETNAQASIINNLKCDQIQGFLYGRPQPESELAGIILKAFRSGLDAPHEQSKAHSKSGAA
jgi:diguanylate cyclase (GGDEF)-like protein